jgi:hypothetical protein
MFWPFRKRRPFKPNYPPGHELVAGHVFGRGFVFKGSEEALRYGFQTLEEATQYWKDLAKIRPHVATEERIRSLQVLASALEEAPFSDEYMMRRRLAEGICAASGRRSCLTCRPGARNKRAQHG